MSDSKIFTSVEEIVQLSKHNTVEVGFDPIHHIYMVYIDDRPVGVTTTAVYDQLLSDSTAKKEKRKDLV